MNTQRNERRNRQWDIELFGHLCIRNTEFTHTRFYSQKVARLLGRLAYYPQRQFGREELIEWLWLDSELPTRSGAV